MNRLNLSIRDKKDLKNFVMAILRQEAFENPRIYKKAVLSTIKELGFDEEWIKTDLANEFDHIMKINEMDEKIRSINTSTNRFYDAVKVKNIIKLLLKKMVYVSDIYNTWDNIPFACKILDKDEFECLKHTCPDYRLIVEAYEEYLKDLGLERVEITMRTMSILDKKLKVLSPDVMMNMSLLKTNNESFDSVFRRELDKLPEDQRDRYINECHIYAVERYYK
nr:hypothetical protein [uncultured Peptostreptococcus sp.]